MLHTAIPHEQNFQFMLIKNLGSSCELLDRSQQKPVPVARSLDKQFAAATAAAGETPIRSPYTKKPRVTSPVVEELVWFTIIRHVFKLVDCIATMHTIYSYIICIKIYTGQDTLRDVEASQDGWDSRLGLVANEDDMDVCGPMPALPLGSQVACCDDKGATPARAEGPQTPQVAAGDPGHKLKSQNPMKSQDRKSKPKSQDPLLQTQSKDKKSPEASNPQKSVNEPRNPQKSVNEPRNPQKSVNEARNPQKSVNEAHNPQKSVNEAHNPQKSVNEPHNRQKSVDEANNALKSMNEPRNPEKSVNEPHNPEKSVNEPHNPEKSVNEANNALKSMNEPHNPENSVKSVNEPHNPEKSVNEADNPEKSMNERHNPQKPVNEAHNPEKSANEPQNREKSVNEPHNREKSVNEALNSQKPVNFPEGGSDMPQATQQSSTSMLPPMLQAKLDRAWIATDRFLLCYSGIVYKRSLQLCRPEPGNEIKYEAGSYRKLMSHVW